MRGNALRYLGRMIQDRTGPRVFVSWLIVAAMVFPLGLATRSQPDPEGPALVNLVKGMHFQMAILAVVVLFHGIVAEDRVKGWYRFYLAKPISPLWYYGQSFVLAVIGMVLFSLGFLAMFSVSIAPAWLWSNLTPSIALAFLIGGMLFALSTITQRDWVWMSVIIVAVMMLRARFPRDDSTLGKVLNILMPPNHLTDELSLTVGQWAWVLGWGAGLFLLGLAVLKWRPLGED